jgi:hypothetical protein
MDPDDDPMLDVFEELASSGFTTSRTMAAELNRRGYKAPRGGIWHQKQVLRVAERLSRDYPDYDSPFIPKALTNRLKARADRPSTAIERLHARHLRPRLELLKSNGVTDPTRIANLLNRAGLCSFNGGRWSPATAKRLVELAYPVETLTDRRVKPVALAKK